MIQMRKLAIMGARSPRGESKRFSCTTARRQPHQRRAEHQRLQRRASTCLPIAAAASSLSRIARIMRPHGAFTCS